MKLNQIELEERTEKALRLCAKVKSLQDEIRRFVGEANLGYDDGIQEVRRIASDGIIKSAQALVENEPKVP